MVWTKDNVNSYANIHNLRILMHIRFNELSVIGLAYGRESEIMINIRYNIWMEWNESFSRRARAWSVQKLTDNLNEVSIYLFSSFFFFKFHFSQFMSNFIQSILSIFNFGKNFPYPEISFSKQNPLLCLRLQIQL